MIVSSAEVAAWSKFDIGVAADDSANIINPVIAAVEAALAVGYELPVSSYTVTNKALTSNIATLTVNAHTVNIGDSITIVLSPADPVFDGTHTVTATTSTTVSYAKTNANVASTASGGTVTDNTPPADLKQAVLMQCARLLKRRYSPEGIASIGPDNIGLRVSRFDPDIETLLAEYKRWSFSMPGVTP